MASVVFLFKIPTGEDQQLGKSEVDFSNVVIEAYTKDGKPLAETPKVAIFGTGKLGGLKGGLNNLQDQREVLDKGKIVALARDAMKEKLAKSRTDEGSKNMHKIQLLQTRGGGGGTQVCKIRGFSGKSFVCCYRGTGYIY